MFFADHDIAFADPRARRVDDVDVRFAEAFAVVGCLAPGERRGEVAAWRAPRAGAVIAVRGRAARSALPRVVRSRLYPIVTLIVCAFFSDPRPDARLSSVSA
jgi:hypothetical protein